MSKHQELISKRTNEELIRDWVVLDELTNGKGATIEQATVRGWMMDEIEKRWPTEFEKWIENSDIDNRIENYIKLN